MIYKVIIHKQFDQPLTYDQHSDVMERVREMYNWIYAQNWKGWNYNMFDYSFEFSDESHYNMFVLRWMN